MKRLGSRGLGSFQVVILVLGFLVASVAIFTLGYTLGQEMALRRASQGDRVFRGSVAMRVPTPTPTAGPEALLYKDLHDKAIEALEGAGDVTPAATEPTATPPRAQATSTPRAATPAIVATATRRPATPTTRPLTPTPRPTKAAPSPLAAERSSGTGPWTVQVGATTDYQEALALNMELRREGFSAFTAQVGSQGQTVYRVRVGRYASRTDADAVVERLKQNPRFRGARVVDQ